MSPPTRRRSPAEVRQLLLDASARVFRNKGYNGATNEEIAGLAGVSASVMFRHFRTKAELFREALVAPFVDSLATITARWQRSFSDPVDEQQMMREFITDIYDNLAAHEEAVKGLVNVDGTPDAAVEDVVELFDTIFAQFRDMRAKAAERRGRFPGGDLELTARLIVGMVAATVSYKHLFLPTGRNRVSRRRLVNHMADLALYGMPLEPVAAISPGE